MSYFIKACLTSLMFLIVNLFIALPPANGLTSELYKVNRERELHRQLRAIQNVGRDKAGHLCVCWAKQQAHKAAPEQSGSHGWQGFTGRARHTFYHGLTLLSQGRSAQCTWLWLICEHNPRGALLWDRSTHVHNHTDLLVAWLTASVTASCTTRGLLNVCRLLVRMFARPHDICLYIWFTFLSRFLSHLRCWSQDRVQSHSAGKGFSLWLFTGIKICQYSGACG